MNILGVDYGERKIGLAISSGFLATPLGIEENTKNIGEKIKIICQREQIGKIVIGLSEGKMAIRQKEFGQKLTKACEIPVEFWDETLTSKEALRKMIEAGVRQKKRRREDAAAAALILQSFLDAQ
ncbi:Holliday junction resolvase RuvX [Candidatus Microgenomates bacterium]|nr:Holliday junction resolvase RuvX [Candidatus Microgenomates bacterium]